MLACSNENRFFFSSNIVKFCDGSFFSGSKLGFSNNQKKNEWMNNKSAYSPKMNIANRIIYFLEWKKMNIMHWNWFGLFRATFLPFALWPRTDFYIQKLYLSLIMIIFFFAILCHCSNSIKIIIIIIKLWWHRHAFVFSFRILCHMKLLARKFSSWEIWKVFVSVSQTFPKHFPNFYF